MPLAMVVPAAVGVCGRLVSPQAVLHHRSRRLHVCRQPTAVAMAAAAAAAVAFICALCGIRRCMRCGEMLSSCPVPLTTTSTCVSTLGGGSVADDHDCMCVDSMSATVGIVVAVVCVCGQLRPQRLHGCRQPVSVGIMVAVVCGCVRDDDCMGVDSRQQCWQQLSSASVTAWRALDQASVGVCDRVRRFRAVWCRCRWWCWRLSVSVAGW